MGEYFGFSSRGLGLGNTKLTGAPDTPPAYMEFYSNSTRVCGDILSIVMQGLYEDLA